MDKITHEMRLAQWTDVIKECAASGLPKTVWCEQNKVNVKQFFYWQRRVRNNVVCNTSATVSIPAGPNFVELRPQVQVLAPENSSLTGEIMLEVNGINVEVTSSTSPELLRMVLEVVRNA